MTENEAREAIRGRLEFGNERQIQAKKFLDSLAEAVEAIEESPVCEGCGGHGEFIVQCDCDNPEDCANCCEDGEYLAECAACDELGHFVIDWPNVSEEVMEAAKDKVRRNAKVYPR